jgi:DNA-binding transcriptional regulator YiaG
LSDTSASVTPLRAARDWAELSQEAVARQLEPPVSVKTLARWEQPGARVKRVRLQQLAVIYGVSVAELQVRERNVA